LGLNNIKTAIPGYWLGGAWASYNRLGLSWRGHEVSLKMWIHGVDAPTSIRPSPVRPARESGIEDESGLSADRRLKPSDDKRHITRKAARPSVTA
jgi:hypothetical protein